MYHSDDHFQANQDHYDAVGGHDSQGATHREDIKKLQQEVSQLKPESIKNMSFEEAMNMMERIVHAMESGDISLDKAVETYEIGMLLKNQCDARLKAAQLKIEKITSDSNGAIKTESFEE